MLLECLYDLNFNPSKVSSTLLAILNNDLVLSYFLKTIFLYFKRFTNQQIEDVKIQKKKRL